MADKTIPNLPELLTGESDMKFAVRRVGQTEDEYVERDNIFSTATVRLPTLIETITLGTAGEFDFDSIPGTYDDLLMIVEATSGVSSGFDRTAICFNSDTTGSNYHRQNQYVYNGSPNDADGAGNEGAYVTGATGASNCIGRLEVTVPHYSSVNKKKTARVYSITPDGAGSMFSGIFAVWWEDDAGTTAIDRIRLRADGHPTDGLLGTAKLYGISDVTIPIIS